MTLFYQFQRRLFYALALSHFRFDLAMYNIKTAIEGLFIKHRNMMVILYHLSAEYLTAKMLAAKHSSTAIISNMVRRELSLAEVTRQ